MSITVPLYGFGGGGGAALNFKVVGNPKPTNPKENTIWIDTDVPITGYYFAAKQPENMAESEVWISTGTESAVEFNALKKDAVQVYPLSAKQYIDGTLVGVAAEIWQSGEWVEWATPWDGLLFDNGNQYESITGGWSSSGVKYTNFTIVAPTIDTSISLATGTTNNRLAIAITANKIDLSGKTKLLANYTSLSRAASVVGISTSKELSGSGVIVAKTMPSAAGIVEVELPSDGGEYYVFVYASSANSTATTAVISKIWAE